MRYTISEDGHTVHDAKTNLIWERQHQSPMTWYQALQAATVAKRTNLHGYADWRVPSREELLSLIELRDSEESAIDQEAFPECPPGWFWTRDQADGVNAWFVIFLNGYTANDKQSNYMFVRLVRSGQCSTC